MGGQQGLADQPAPVDLTADVGELRDRVLESLKAQGFKLAGNDALLSPVADKDNLRRLHATAVHAQRERARGALERKDAAFTTRLASGASLRPGKIDPKLVILDVGKSEDALLWRWCSLHWSVPVSGGYGRRIRALVVDAGHDNAVMGLIGLGDPVFSMGVRDSAIGWTSTQRAARLTSVMDAFVLGAIPPYNELLGGKLVGLLLKSDELRDEFSRRYGHRTTLIAERDPRAALSLVSTSSALGRSSVYNRVRSPDGSLAMRSIGYTQGTGDFHFSGEIYDLLARAARAEASSQSATHRHAKWGTGFRNRREVIQRGLRALGLNHTRLRLHGVQREVFLVPLATNSTEWLQGSADELEWTTLPGSALSAWWRERWLIPRAERTDRWRAFDPEEWRLWPAVAPTTPDSRS